MGSRSCGWASRFVATGHQPGLARIVKRKFTIPPILLISGAKTSEHNVHILVDRVADVADRVLDGRLRHIPVSSRGARVCGALAFFAADEVVNRRCYKPRSEMRICLKIGM
jgi:hypothetical protein